MKKRREKTPKDYYDSRLKPPKAFFEWCYSNMRTYVWENKQQKIIASPRKHKEVIKKRLMKTSALTFYDTCDKFDIVLSSNKRIERHTYEIVSLIKEGKQYFESSLINLHVFSQNTYIKLSTDYQGNYTWGLKPIVSGMWKYLPECYPNQWRERLERISELKYLSLERLSVDCLPHYYKYREQLEFIQKVHAKGLENEVHHKTIDFRKLTMRWLKTWKSFFKNSTRSTADLKLKQLIEQRNVPYVDGIEQYLNWQDVEEMNTDIPLMKLQNYLLKQQHFYRYYKDYLALVNELKIPLTKRSLFPVELTVAHDKLVDTLNSIKLEAENKAFQKRATDLFSFEKTINGFSFLIPKKANELVVEGKALNHCVGSSHYINNHANGEITIVFIRNEHEPTIPYYTLELVDNRVIQVRGNRNCAPTNTIKKAIDEWLVAINSYKRKERKIA